MYVCKVEILWEGHKALKKSPICFDVYSETSKQIGDCFKLLRFLQKTWTLCLKLHNKMHSYFSPSASGLLVLRCTQPIDSGKKRLQVSIVIKATRQWMVLTPTMIRCKKSFLRLLPSFYVSIVPPASTTTWSSILTVDAQWKICRKFLAFQKFFWKKIQFTHSK